MSIISNQAIVARLRALCGLRQPQATLRLGCVLAGLALPGLAGAQAELSTYVSPIEPVNQYFEAIEAIEAEYGPYAAELSDLYTGLGQSLLDSGDYEQARDAFNRGVIVIRVNSGPNSPEQTNQLYLIANIETLLADLETADEVVHNIYSINSKYYGVDNPKMLPVLERMYGWYLMTRPPDSTIVDLPDFERTVVLTEKMVSLSEASKGSEHPDTAVAYRRLGEAHFQFVRYLMKNEMFSAVSTGLLGTRDGRESTVRDHYREGRRAFEKYLEMVLANESTTPLEHAEALADLADWYLVFERTGHAWDHYEQAYAVLEQSDNYAELADRQLGRPKPVHFLEQQQDFLNIGSTDMPELKLDISMTITDFGSVRDAEILNAPDELSEDDIRRIKRQVSSIRFRPALKDGEVITTKDFVWQYAVVPLGRSS